MNGIRDNIFVLDSSFCINFLNTRIDTLPGGELYISQITRIELVSKPEFMGNSSARQEASDFISRTTVIPLNDKVEYQTVRIRRNNPGIKLPDAIIAATALAMNARFLSCDKDLVSQICRIMPESRAEYVKPLDAP
ncbi:MAG: PIN domain-containing protein [Spirochaetaceae bacterium]|nr:PIN domain-containing protein [Spirochaetaceae bacterium]